MLAKFLRVQFNIFFYHFILGHALQVDKTGNVLGDYKLTDYGEGNFLIETSTS